MSAEQSWWRSDSLTVSLRQHRTTCPQLGGKPITGKRGKLSVAFLPALISPVCTLLRPLRGFPGKSPTEESARPARLQLYFVWIKKYLLLLQGPPLCYYTFFPFATSLWFFPAVHILGDFFFFWFCIIVFTMLSLCGPRSWEIELKIIQVCSVLRIKIYLFLEHFSRQNYKVL